MGIMIHIIPLRIITLIILTIAITDIQHSDIDFQCPSAGAGDTLHTDITTLFTLYILADFTMADMLLSMATITTYT